MNICKELPEQIHIDLLQMEELCNPRCDFTFSWKTELSGYTMSSPCFWNGFVFLNSSNGFIYALDVRKVKEEEDKRSKIQKERETLARMQNMHVEKLELKDEERKEIAWKKELVNGEKDLPVDSAPVAASDGIVYSNSFRYLYAFDGKTGEVINKKEGFFNPSPLVLKDGRLFAGERASLCAYRQKDLEKLWEFRTSGYVESAPLVSGDMVFVGSLGGNIYALDVQDGELCWEFNTGKEVEATPSVCGSTVFAGSKDGVLYALDRFKGTVKWSQKVDDEICCYSPVYKDSVYVFSVSGNIYAFSVERGKLKWETNVSGTIYSSPVIDKGVIYLGSSGRSRVFYAISPHSGQTIWHHNIQEDIFASPCTGTDNYIYINAIDGALYSFIRKDLMPVEEVEEAPVPPGIGREKKVVSPVLPAQEDKKISQEKEEEKLKKELQKKKKKDLEEKLKARARLKREEQEKKLKQISEQKKDVLEEKLRVRSRTKIIDAKFKAEMLKKLKKDGDKPLSEAEKLTRLEEKLKVRAQQKAKVYEDKLKALAEKNRAEELKKQAEKQEDPGVRAEKFFNVGKTQLEAKMLEPAIASFRRALELIPHNRAYILGLARALSEKGDFIESAECYEKALESKRDKETLSAALDNFVNAGDAYLKRNQYEKAHDYYSKAMDLKEDGRAYFGIGDICIAKEDISGAIEAFSKGLVYDRDFSFLVKLAELYSHTELDFEDSLKRLAELGGIEDESSREYYLKGVLLEEEDWDEAVLSYQKAFEMQVDFILPYYRLGILFLLAEEDDRAEEMFNKVLDIDPSYAKAHAGLGKIKQKAGRLREAEEITRKAIILDSGCNEAYCLLSRIFMEKGDLLEAELCLEKVKGIEREFPDFLVVRGELFLRKKMEKEALDSLLKAVRSYSVTWDILTYASSLSSIVESSRVISSLTEVYWEEEYYDLLPQMYKRQIKLNPEDLSARTRLAGIYRNLKKFETAIKLLTDAVEKNPDDTDLKAELAENLYRQARRDVDKGKTEKAIAGIKSAIKLVDNEYKYYLVLGDIHFKASKFSKALKAYLQARSVEPRNSQICFKVGQAFEKVENYKESLKNYSEAVSLDKSKVHYIANLARVSIKLGQYRRAFSITKKALKKSGIDSKLRVRLTKVYNLSAGKIWLNFRFNGNGFQPDDKLTIGSKAGFLNKRWEFSTEKRIISSPVASDRIVYIASTDGRLYAIKQKSGGLLWKFDTENAIRSTPAIGKGLIYIATNDGTLYAIEMSSGRKIWSFDCQGPMNSSPVLFGEKYLCFGDGKGNFYGLSPKKGRVIWEYSTSEKITSSPVRFEDTVCFGGWDGNFYALDISTGKKKWVKDLGAPIHSSPAIFDDFIFTGLLNKKVMAIKASSGKKCWEFYAKGPVSSSPAVAYNKVFIGSDDCNLYTLDAKSGERLWSFPTGGKIMSSPAVAGKYVYFGSEDKNIYAVDIKTQKSFKFETGRKVYSSPVIANRMLFVGSEDKKLYAFEG